MSHKFTFEGLDWCGSLERKISMSGLVSGVQPVQPVPVDDPDLPVPDDEPLPPEPDPGPLPPDPPIVIPPLPPTGPVGPG